jgi:hypothetical protein
MEDFSKELFKKLINESITIIILIAVSYYFVTREREQSDKLLNLYERDRQVLIEKLEDCKGE